MSMSLFIEVYLRFFFLLTPFFVLSTFLSMTPGMADAGRRRLAVRVGTAVVAVCLVLYFFGETIFRIFGISLDAFRVGAGALLFLTAVTLVRERPGEAAPAENEDIAVVPLSIPITVGPATTGAIMLMGAQHGHDGWAVSLFICGALVAASLSVAGILYMAPVTERLLKPRGIAVLSKLTGLILSAMAAEMVFTGARALLYP